MWRLAWVLASGCSFTPGTLETTSPDAPDDAEVVSTTDELVRYELDETEGTTVHDTGPAPALDLAIDVLANTTWGGGALRISSAVTIQSAGPAAKVSSACKQTDEVTIEAWVAPLSTSQAGPARIITVSLDGYLRNVTLAQDGPRWVFRTRNPMTSDNGMPNLETPNIVTTSLAHVVGAQSATERRIYVDGVLQAEDTLVGTFSTWDDSYALFVANEGGTEAVARFWRGSIHRIVIYRRALTDEEVAALHDSGL